MSTGSLCPIEVFILTSLFATILLQLTIRHLLDTLHQFYLRTFCLYGIIPAVWYQFWQRTNVMEGDPILSLSVKYDVQKNAEKKKFKLLHVMSMVQQSSKWGPQNFSRDLKIQNNFPKIYLSLSLILS